MDHIQASDKQVSNTYEKDIIIVQKPAWIPCKHKRAASNDNTEYLSKAMKKDIAVKSGQAYPKQDQHTE